MPRSSHEEFYARKLLAGCIVFCDSDSCAKHKGLWEGQRPRCPIRRHTGNEDVAPPVRLNPVQSSLQMVWLNPARSSESQFQETIVPRVLRVPHVPLRHRQSAKRKASYCTAICKARSTTKWGCALRVVERQPLFCDSVVKDQIGSFLCHFPSAQAHLQSERSL